VRDERSDELRGRARAGPGPSAKHVVALSRELLDGTCDEAARDPTACVHDREADAELDEPEHELPTIRLDGDLPRNARLAERALDRGAVRPALGWNHEATPREIDEAQRPRASERMGLWHHQHLPDLGEQLRVEVRGNDLEGGDADMRFPRTHGVERALAVAREQPELRALGDDRSEAVAEQIQIRAFTCAQHDGLGASVRSQRLGEITRAVADLAGEARDADAIDREDEPLTLALVERGAELLRQLLHLNVQRRLRQVERLRGAREAQVLGERGERLEPLQLEHRGPSHHVMAPSKHASLPPAGRGYPSGIMSKNDSTGASKKLSWLLRHGANEAGLEMDAAGWAEIEDVRRVLHMGRAALESSVLDNTKQRLEVRGTRIRASQGHSLAAMPVTCDALEASWERHDASASVFHGTRVTALEGIAREGILPGARTHVHLAEAVDSGVGKRASVDVMLEVSPTALGALGIGIYRSPNGVLLVRSVPVAAIVGLLPQVERARRKADELRALFGWNHDASRRDVGATSIS
jgi:putative RNA 2'-phosphotransferase